MGSARSYAASGIEPGQRIVSTYNAGPFVAGAALASFDLVGLCHVPVGTGSTERLLLALEHLRPDAAVLTPSYAAHLIEAAAGRGFDLRGSSVRRVLVAGEPGGGEASFRALLEDGWGARVTEAMGIGDIGISLWGECEEQDGMHLGARGFVHPELVDTETGGALPLAHEARGELVLTHLSHRAAPLLRFRTRDYVEVRTSPCACGRTGPRVRCLGRTDDMLIVRGVNVFPSAIEGIVRRFEAVDEFQIEVFRHGELDEARVVIEVDGGEGARSVRDAVQEALRASLGLRLDVACVAPRTLPRWELKARRVVRK